MPAKIMGHNWEEPHQLCPHIHNAFEITGDYVRSVNRVIRPDWVLDYEISTYGFVRVGSRRTPWRPRLPRTAHLYPPRTPYWEDTRKETGQRHSTWISFDGGAAAGLERFVGRESPYARFLDPTGELGEILRQAALVAHRSGAHGFWRAQALLCRAIDCLHRAVRGADDHFLLGQPGANAGPPALVRAVEAFLKEHVAEKVTLDRIARHVHASVSSLSHRYREAAGETPIQALARLRISYAKPLLLQGQSLDVIADQLGFSDAFHLSKTFKRVEGVSPSRFRDRLRRPAGQP